MLAPLLPGRMPSVATLLSMCCHLWLPSVVTTLSLCYVACYQVLPHCCPCVVTCGYRVLSQCCLCVTCQVVECCHIDGSVLSVSHLCCHIAVSVLPGRMQSVATLLSMCCHLWLPSVVTMLSLCYVACYQVLPHCCPCVVTCGYRVLSQCCLCVTCQVVECCHIDGSVLSVRPPMLSHYCLCVTWQDAECCHIACCVLPDRLPSVASLLAMCYLAGHRVLSHCCLCVTECCHIDVWHNMVRCLIFSCFEFSILIFLFCSPFCLIVSCSVLDYFSRITHFELQIGLQDIAFLPLKASFFNYIS